MEKGDDGGGGGGGDDGGGGGSGGGGGGGGIEGLPGLPLDPDVLGRWLYRFLLLPDPYKTHPAILAYLRYPRAIIEETNCATTK